MKRVFTITANLLSEYTLELDNLKIPTKGTHRATKSFHKVGGKGINVSRALKSMGQENVAMCMPAGKEGEKCLAALSAENLEIAPVFIEGETRIGTVLKTKNLKKELSFFSNDVEIKDGDFNKVLTYLEAQVKKNDIVAICGSVPNFSKSFGYNLLKLSQKKDFHLCIDTYGKALKFFCDKEVLLLKINKDEALGLNLSNSKKAKDNFFALEKTSKAKFLAMTNGAKTAYLYADNVSTKHKIAKAKLKSATGCGDLVFASMINAILNGASSIRQVYDNALNYATTTALKQQENK